MCSGRRHRPPPEGERRDWTAWRAGAADRRRGGRLGPVEGALGWAVRQAELTGGVVEPVIARQFPTTYGYVAAPTARGIDCREIAAAVLADAVAEVSTTAGPAKIGSKVAQGHAAEVLLTEPAGADLLVVGNRGHGAFREALLGSVSQSCAHHATCPVVIIRAVPIRAGSGDNGPPDAGADSGAPRM